MVYCISIILTNPFDLLSRMQTGNELEAQVLEPTSVTLLFCLNS